MSFRKLIYKYIDKHPNVNLELLDTTLKDNYDKLNVPNNYRTNVYDLIKSEGKC